MMVNSYKVRFDNEVWWECDECELKYATKEDADNCCKLKSEEIIDV